jgi:uncharacterized protein (DUF885 family)
MLKTYFEEYINLHPSFGSFIGMRQYDNRYENVLDKEYDIKMKTLCKKYRTSKDAVLQWIVTQRLKGYKYNFDLMPLSSFNNDLIDFIFSNSILYPLKTINDLKNLISRYEQFMSFISSCETNMKKGMKLGYTIPVMICEKIIKQIKNNGPSKYIIPVPDHLQNKYPVVYQKYIETAKMYYEAVKAITNFIENEYIHECRRSYGLCDLPNGKEMYRYAVETLLSMKTSHTDIAKIHAYGKDEVARISKEMEKLKIRLGYPCDMHIMTFYHKMMNHPKYKFKSKTELLDAYKHKQDYIRKHIVPKYFKDHVSPYDIKEVPKMVQASSPSAFYIQKIPSKGLFYINLKNLKDNPKYSVTALSMHEGEPGHHYHYQYMLEKKLPFYKIFSMDGCVFSEGWGLYAETLYDYSDEEYFGKLTFELLRAIRLVIDTGIHYYGWSFDKAVDYMKHHVAMTDTDIKSEVERYICMPAQALCYKIGEKYILEWRDKYIKCFGNSKKSIQDFHETLLEDGILPLEILNKKMKRICG